MPRMGYAGNRVSIGGGGATPGVVVVPADMVAADTLLEVASLRYLYDTTALVPDYEQTARSLGIGASGQRFGGALPMLSNGSTYDPQQNNVAAGILGSTARTVQTASGTLTNYNGRGCQAILNVTVASGTGGLSLTFQAQDPISGSWYNLSATPTAVTATGLTVYELYPGVGAAAGGVTQRTSGALPRTWRILVAVGDASSYTYSVSAFTLV